jgi:hypothetical protein
LDTEQKKVSTWFNEKCKTAIENRGKTKLKVMKDNNNENKNLLTQKQRDIKRTIKIKKNRGKRKNEKNRREIYKFEKFFPNN